ncbi:MAG: energy transducer TonB, partial [Prevotella sp.]|nr:energy transducer TonB [Prevotella sp.]
ADIADVRQVVVEKPIEKAPVEVEEKVFDVVEQMPSFPGGDAALMQYLQKSIRYPVVAEENGIQGRVIIRFVVEKNGSIGEVQVARSVDPSLDKEAVRVVKSMPKWIPGKQNGSAVRVWFTLPVQFRLQ